MALGERFRGTGSGRVAPFLAAHQDCDVGFDVTRERGPVSGRLKITCLGCGQEVEYRASEAADAGTSDWVQLQNGGSLSGSVAG